MSTVYICVVWSYEQIIQVEDKHSADIHIHTIKFNVNNLCTKTYMYSVRSYISHKIIEICHANSANSCTVGCGHTNKFLKYSSSNHQDQGCLARAQQSLHNVHKRVCGSHFS